MLQEVPNFKDAIFEITENEGNQIATISVYGHKKSITAAALIKVMRDFGRKKRFFKYYDSSDVPVKHQQLPSNSDCYSAFACMSMETGELLYYL